MRSVSTNFEQTNKIIPIVAQSLYRSLEYSIKKLLALKTRMTLTKMTDFILHLNEKNVLGKFKIDKNILNKKRINQALWCLCREKKVVQKKRYFESTCDNNGKMKELVRLKTISILLVF